MSAVHRVFGRPWCLCACSRVSSDGSHCRIMDVHSVDGVVASLCIHFHFMRLCMTTHSSNLSFFILASASWVHRLTQSTHGSRSSVVSLSGGSFGCVVLSLSVSIVSVDEPVISYGSCVTCDSGICSVCVSHGWRSRWRRGEWRIMRSICLCVRRSLFSSSVLRVLVM